MGGAIPGQAMGSHGEQARMASSFAPASRFLLSLPSILTSVLLLETEISPFLPKLPLVVVFITAIETEDRESDLHLTDVLGNSK